MRLSGKFILFIGIIVALSVIIYLTTSPYQRGSYYNYGLGLFEYKIRNYHKAGRYFERSYKADNDNLMALYFEAQSRIMEGENKKPRLKDDPLFRQAAVDCDELTKKAESRGHKNLYLFHYTKARAHLNLEEFVSAKDSITKAIKLKAVDYDIQILYGRILIGLKDFEQAINVLYDASRLKVFKPYEAYFYLALAYENIRDTDRAWHYYDQAIKSFPSKAIKEEAYRRKLEIGNKPSGK